MTIIPGFIISYATFPGVIAHEIGHQLACKITDVRVFDVKYFQFNLEISGYVRHEQTDNPWKQLLITYGPLIFNFIIGIIFVFPLAVMWAMSSMRYVYPFWSKALVYVLAYIGISCLANAFPSSGDAISLFTSVVKNKNIPLLPRILVAPFVLIIIACSVAKFFWFDFIFAFGVPAVIKAILCHL